MNILINPDSCYIHGILDCVGGWKHSLCKKLIWLAVEEIKDNRAFAYLVLSINNSIKAASFLERWAEASQTIHTSVSKSDYHHRQSHTVLRLKVVYA